jgi:hypothetical protein
METGLSAESLKIDNGEWTPSDKRWVCGKGSK